MDPPRLIPLLPPTSIFRSSRAADHFHRLSWAQPMTRLGEILAALLESGGSARGLAVSIDGTRLFWLIVLRRTRAIARVLRKKQKEPGTASSMGATRAGACPFACAIRRVLGEGREIPLLFEGGLLAGGAEANHGVARGRLEAGDRVGVRMVVDWRGWRPGKIPGLGGVAPLARRHLVPRRRSTPACRCRGSKKERTLMRWVWAANGAGNEGRVGTWGRAPPPAVAGPAGPKQTARGWTQGFGLGRRHWACWRRWQQGRPGRWVMVNRVVDTPIKPLKNIA